MIIYIGGVIYNESISVLQFILVLMLRSVYEMVFLQMI